MHIVTKVRIEETPVSLFTENEASESIGSREESLNFGSAH